VRRIPGWTRKQVTSPTKFSKVQFSTENETEEGLVIVKKPFSKVELENTESVILMCPEFKLL
jgi:hypothetical protein